MFTQPSGCPYPKHVLEIHGAGTPCSDESRFGAQLHEVGPCQVPFWIWLNERKKRQEAVIIHENTPGFNENLIEEALADTHKVHVLELCPSMLGYPMRRLRKITIAVLKAYTLALPLEELLARLARRVVMTPEDYLS